MHRIIFLFALLVGLAPLAARAAESRTLSRAELLDRIRGGWAGQMIGDIQGLPFEFKYKDAPGPLPDFVPNLPRCKSDDDTDIEWVNLMAMDRFGVIFVPYPDVAREWVRSINKKVWVANKRARELMGDGVVPPWTSHPRLNPHSRYNLSGQFCVESYGMLAPGMPAAAAKIGRHYARVAVRGEPIQATGFWTAMVSLAYFEHDVEKLAQAALGAVDPQSQHAEMVRDVLAWHRENPADWKAVRAKIQQKYRDERKWNMNATVTNGAFVLTALLCGKGDFIETLRISFAIGYDADCNAATCGTILGVILGAKAMEAHADWKLPTVYENVTRDGLPQSQTIDELVAMTARLVEKVILAEGGKRTGDEGNISYQIMLQKPAMLETLEKESRDTTDTVWENVRLDALKQLDSPNAAARSFAALRLAGYNRKPPSPAEMERIWAVLRETQTKDEVLRPFAMRAIGRQ